MPATQHNHYGTGRRKTATARVYLKPGSGRITVNDRSLDLFFGRETGRMIVRQPLEAVKLVSSFDIAVRVDGGGIKSIALEKLLSEHPERVIEFAVKGMLPKNPLGRRMFRKLHVFAGGEHPHKAQQPKPLDIQ